MFRKYFETFSKYRFLLYDLIAGDFKIKYRRSFLGVAWSMLNPIMMMLIMGAVFSKLLAGITVPNFYLYLMSGQTAFNFFSDSTSSANYSIVDSAPLIKKVYIPKYIFPLEKVLFSFINTLFSVAAYLIIMLFSKHVSFHLSILLFPVPLLALLFFSIGLGMLLSAVCVFFRDMKHLYSVLIIAWMYMTPIFYFRHTMTGEIMSVVMVVNPLTWYVEYLRTYLYYIPHGQPLPFPITQMNLVCFGWGILLTLLGLLLFRKAQDRFILYI